MECDLCCKKMKILVSALMKMRFSVGEVKDLKRLFKNWFCWFVGLWGHSWPDICLAKTLPEAPFPKAHSRLACLWKLFRSETLCLWNFLFHVKLVSHFCPNFLRLLKYFVLIFSVLLYIDLHHLHLKTVNWVVSDFLK